MLISEICYQIKGTWVALRLEIRNSRNLANTNSMQSRTTTKNKEHKRQGGRAGTTDQHTGAAARSHAAAATAVITRQVLPQVFSVVRPFLPSFLPSSAPHSLPNVAKIRLRLCSLPAPCGRGRWFSERRRSRQLLSWKKCPSTQSNASVRHVSPSLLCSLCTTTGRAR